MTWRLYSGLQNATETSDIIARGPKLLKALRSELELVYTVEPQSGKQAKRRVAVRDAILSARLPGVQLK